MVVMDIEKIFANFKDESATVVVDFSQHPVVWIGMFKKIITNHISFKETIIKKIKKDNPELEEDEIRIAGDIILYSRAWEYIKNVDLSMESHIDALLSLYSEDLMMALKKSKRHYERYEEYEKCAFIRNIIDRINLHQEKFGFPKEET